MHIQQCNVFFLSCHENSHQLLVNIVNIANQPVWPQQAFTVVYARKYTKKKLLISIIYITINMRISSRATSSLMYGLKRKYVWGGSRASSMVCTSERVREKRGKREKSSYQFKNAPLNNLKHTCLCGY